MKLFSISFIALAMAMNVYGDTECQQKNSKISDQDFGMGLTANDILTSMVSPWMFPYFRPWGYLESLTRDLGSTIKTEKDKFQINLDVQHFAPEEIVVKTSDGYVVIEAKHEEKKDEHGYVSRQFVRRYALPKGAESENVVSELSSDGVLTITAPRKEVDSKGERVVPITKTGPVRMESSEKSKESCTGNEKCEL
ncbi:protein lethal(2)essential for life-like [Battus philenor]|uniref:protein lethal(2)essential for life-like n=1 Tax=Battus philenor TaxID=42288 RepID=UPI0035D08C22